MRILLRAVGTKAVLCKAASYAHELTREGAQVLLDWPEAHLAACVEAYCRAGFFARYEGAPVDLTFRVVAGAAEEAAHAGPDVLLVTGWGFPSFTRAFRYGPAAWAALLPYFCTRERPDEEAPLGHDFAECGGYSQGEGRPERVKRYCRFCELETSRDARYPGEAT